MWGRPRSGTAQGTDVLEWIARTVNPRAKVWRRSQLPTVERGIKVLATPLEHEDYVARHLEAVADEQRILLERIPRVRDVQSARLLLLHCASARANYQLRSVLPNDTSEFAAVHDEGLWRCLCSILQVDPVQPDIVRETATVPLSLGGPGLRSVSRTRTPAFWASWADCLGMIRQRHPDVAAQLVLQLEGHPHTPSLEAAASAARSLRGVQGFEPPSWEVLTHGVRPAPRQPDEFEPGCERKGWQDEVASRVEERYRDGDLFTRLNDASKALMRSHGGVGSGLALDVPVVSGHPFGTALVPNPSPSSSSPSPPFDRAQLPVWPSTRFQWPPPRSLCSCWGSGEEGIRSGERRSPYLSRSRG